MLTVASSQLRRLTAKDDWHQAVEDKAHMSPRQLHFVVLGSSALGAQLASFAVKPNICHMFGTQVWDTILKSQGPKLDTIFACLRNQSSER